MYGVANKAKSLDYRIRNLLPNVSKSSRIKCGLPETVRNKGNDWRESYGKLVS